jgi:osmotically inducible lipoprotein OsmB
MSAARGQSRRVASWLPLLNPPLAILSQGHTAMRVQLIAVVFALTLAACTHTQTTLGGAAVGGVAGAAVAGPIGAAVGAGTGAFVGSR